MRKGDREEMEMTRTGRCVGAVWRSGRYRAEDIIGAFKAGGSRYLIHVKKLVEFMLVVRVFHSLSDPSYIWCMLCVIAMMKVQGSRR